jgi:peroxiredoxin
LRFRAIAVLLMLVAIAAMTWRADLLTFARPGKAPRALELRPPAGREPARVDVVLAAVPVGMRRLEDGRGVLLVHYWAPWERHARTQAALLDSLRRDPAMEGIEVVVVCFDPFPSVARFVARQRLRLPVLLDGRGELRAVLPCPSIPFTYVLDREGRIAVAQPGEVDWWSPRTREVLAALKAESPVEAIPRAARRRDYGTNVIALVRRSPPIVRL